MVEKSALLSNFANGTPTIAAIQVGTCILLSGSLSLCWLLLTNPLYSFSAPSISTPELQSVLRALFERPCCDPCHLFRSCFALPMQTTTSADVLAADAAAAPRSSKLIEMKDEADSTVGTRIAASLGRLYSYLVIQPCLCSLPLLSR